jgi:hypothetical protein
MNALTAEERAELNAWIAEHIYGAQWYDDSYFLDREALRWSENNNLLATRDMKTKHVRQSWNLYYTDDWSAAGPLFDRYTWTLEHTLGFGKDAPILYHVWAPGMILLATGTTGPEAIVKAVKKSEEQQRT